ncbi:MAG: deoxyribodipyrimidine photolyase [Planctomycetota bacterium]
MSTVPELRIRAVADQPVRDDGEFVVYWMIAQRRRRANFALQRATWWCKQLGRPLLVLEALRCGYRWASDRLHRFVLDGMRDHQGDFADSGATYHPYVEPEAGAGKGLLQALGERASVVVTDEFPCFFLPRMVDAAAARLPVRLEAVDGNGLLPLRAADRTFLRAVDFRRFLQKELRPHLAQFPVGDPLRRDLPDPVPVPKDIAARWPRAAAALLDGDREALAALPIDHEVGPAPGVRGGPIAGGPIAGGAALRAFLADKLDRYDERNQPDAAAESGLSPYLHFGHIGSHQVFAGLAKLRGWTPDRITGKRDGARGWYGLDDAAEGFLDQLVTWRELGYNMSSRSADYGDYASLPEWARESLEQHAHDARAHVYSLDELAAAATHDEVWNAAQRQLRDTGVLHNYLRMLWGKKVLEWTRHPEEAWGILVELNNRYALDGRNPNSYSGIGWVFGRYDRPWAPEREIFGRIRYMTSQSTQRKLRLKGYLARFGADGAGGGVAPD